MIYDIAKRLKSAMDSHGITSTELAKRANVKPSFLYDILNGKSANPSTIKLANVAETLGMTLSALIGEEEEPSKFPPSAPAGGEYVAISSLLMDGVLSSGGKLPAMEQQVGPYYFRRTWIKDRLQSVPEKLKLVMVRGDSMEPSLFHSDIVLIDTSKKSPTPPGLFAMYDGMGIVIRRLEYISQSVPPSLRIIPDNGKYETHERPIADSLIIGRVVWFAREM